jgi:hypothetical protein
MFALIANFANAQYQVKVSVNTPSGIANADIQNSHTYYSTTAASNWGGYLRSGQGVTQNVVLARAGTSALDSVNTKGCTFYSNAAAVAGKIALVRRGDCTFSEKAYYAFKAGAAGVIIYNRNAGEGFINMAATTPWSDTVTIPTVSISLEDATPIVNTLATAAVNMTIKRQGFYGANTTFNYQTPAVEFDMPNYVTLGNPIGRDTTATIKVEVKDPSNVLVRTMSRNVTLVASTANQDLTYSIQDTSYRPTVRGKYTAIFTNTLTRDTLIDNFVITDYTFGLDLGKDYNFYAEDSVRFLNANLKSDVGSIFTTNLRGRNTKVTHAAFALRTPNQFAVNEQFAVILYDMDPNGTGSIGGGSFTYGAFGIVASKPYNINGRERPDSLIYVEFATPVTLKDTSQYLVMIQYDGSVGGNGRSPKYTTGGKKTYFELDAVVNAYQNATSPNFLYGGGLDGSTQFVVRMYTQGFRLGTNDVPALEASQVAVFPNPSADNTINMKLDLKNIATELDINITDIYGRTVKTAKLNGVQNGVYPVDISGLTSGHYFLSVQCEEGFRTKMFEVVK